MRVPRVASRRRRQAAEEVDVRAVYRMMVRMRLVDEALVEAWADGLVPGEYHSGIGEEGINAGVLAHLDSSDSLHLDHRNTGPFVGRGADPEALLLEVLGSEQGMNRGMAGHMHLLAPELSTGCDGMVGAGGPLAVGAATAHQQLRPGAVAVAFFGEATLNAGMLMEAFNMAVAWRLPILFICKDNKWSITTRSADVTGGTALARARSFGMPVRSVRGERVEEVHSAAGELLADVRAGRGPGFLFATCHRPGGHFEGDPMVRLLRRPGAMASQWGPEFRNSLGAAESGTWLEKAGGLAEVSRRGTLAVKDWSSGALKDPLALTRPLVHPDAADRIEDEERAEILPAVARARDAVAGRPVFGTTKGAAR